MNRMEDFRLKDIIIKRSDNTIAVKEQVLDRSLCQTTLAQRVVMNLYLSQECWVAYVSNLQTIREVTFIGIDFLIKNKVQMVAKVEFRLNFYP